jgi:hypothetical protein
MRSGRSGAYDLRHTYATFALRVGARASPGVVASVSLQDFALGLGARLIGQASEDAAFALVSSSAECRAGAGGRTGRPSTSSRVLEA